MNWALRVSCYCQFHELGNSAAQFMNWTISQIGRNREILYCITMCEICSMYVRLLPQENSAQPVKYDIKPPAPLNVPGNKVESWKLFKKRWTNYETLSGIGKAPREIQVVMLKTTLMMKL